MQKSRHEDCKGCAAVRRFLMRRVQLHRRYFKANFYLGGLYKIRKELYLNECVLFEKKTIAYLKETHREGERFIL